MLVVGQYQARNADEALTVALLTLEFKASSLKVTSQCESHFIIQARGQRGQTIFVSVPK